MTETWIDPLASLREQVQTMGKLVEGAELLRRLPDDAVGTGVTAKEAVHRDGPVTLYRFTPHVERPHPIPMLVVYAIFNRYYMMDLEENRSLIRNLLDRGLDLYLVDWGYPTRADRWTTLEDYVDGYIDDAVEILRERHEVDAVDVLGVCQGGTVSLCYAALHPEKVKNLVTMVTPVDFELEDNIIGAWVRAIDVDAMVDSLGLVPGELLGAGFLLRSPFERHLRKYVDLVDLLDDEAKLLVFLRMEKWIFDTPDVPGETLRQWVRDFYQGNKLVKGELELGGRRVDLRNVTMPVLNVYAEHDDVAPPASARALAEHVGTDDYSELTLPVGHIGVYVSSKTQLTLPAALTEWLTARGGV